MKKILLIALIIISVQSKTFAAAAAVEELSVPHLFNTIQEMAQSEQLKPEYGDIVFVATGSQNYAHSRNSFGYVQSLPYFIEKFLRNPQLKPHVKVILIDECFENKGNKYWDTGYKNSDIARYLKEKQLQKFEDNIYIVADLLYEPTYNPTGGNPNAKPLQNYLTTVLNKNGAVFLLENEGSLKETYNSLLSIKNALGRVFYMGWASMLKPLAPNGARADVVAQFWDGAPYKQMDNEIFWLKISFLFECDISLRLTNQELAERLYPIKPSKEQIKEEEVYYALRRDAIKKGEAAILSAFEDRSKHTSNQFNDTYKSMEKREIVEFQEGCVNKEFQHNCTIGSLIPIQQAKYFPLIDVDAVIAEDLDGNNAVTITPHISVAGNPFRFFDYLNKKSLYELSGIPLPEKPAQ